jgi:aminoglycoside phosphotransferase family enzyme/predicted kinase
MQSKSEREFAARLYALTRPESFPSPLPPNEAVVVIQTHASAVLLAGDYAYKLKKPKDFGFFDYSTAAQRRHFCIEEVRLNTRLAPHIYRGVAPVLASADSSVRFGPALGLQEIPRPRASYMGARVVDYAVVMRRLPEEATLAAHVADNTATSRLLAAVAWRIADYHRQSQADEHVASFGSLAVIAGNWEENFAQMRPFVGRALDAAPYDHIVAYVHRFLDQRATLFGRRVQQGRIRDCHGDLRLQHVYVLDDTPEASPEASHSASPDACQIAIVDCIEFNERFRYSDVAAEVAFLAMELDAAARPDLARTFIDAYVLKTHDEELRELLPFYACYRACVRGKVLAFQLEEPEVPDEQQEFARRQAAALFDLAALYARTPTWPTLLVVGGLMGTGKSTMATALRGELGWAVRSSDTTRKRLAKRELAQPDTSGFGQGIYTTEWSARTYAALLDAAHSVLAASRSVILDATYSQRSDRQNAAQLAHALGAQAVFIECVCSQGVALARLQRRWTSRVARRQLSRSASAASDGRPELYEAQRAAWQPFDPATEPGLTHVRITTDRTLADSVAATLDALQIPRLACWLSPVHSE